MTNREKWLAAAYDFNSGRVLGHLILTTELTIWRRVHAFAAIHCLMFYVAAYPEGPPNATQ
jgi:hypothetical protein